MPDYDVLAPFYDGLMGDRREHADYIRSLLDRICPQARTLLELACGTGSLLRWLGERYELTGVDVSGPMLEIAAAKAPGARLVQADMTSVRLGEHFDVVLCAFDSVNHLESLERWLALFDRAREHLAPWGAFVFDVNTLHKLQRLARKGPHRERFDDRHLLVTDVRGAGQGAFDWSIDVYEQVGERSEPRCSVTIREIGFPLETIEEALLDRFAAVEAYDRERGRPSKLSDRLHVVCSRPRPPVSR